MDGTSHEQEIGNNSTRNTATEGDSAKSMTSEQNAKQGSQIMTEKHNKWSTADELEVGYGVRRSTVEAGTHLFFFAL